MCLKGSSSTTSESVDNSGGFSRFVNDTQENEYVSFNGFRGKKEVGQEKSQGFLPKGKGFSRISKWICTPKMKILASVLAGLILGLGGTLALHYTVGLGNAWQHTVDFFKSKIVAWITLPTAAIAVGAGGGIGFLIGRKTAPQHPPTNHDYSHVSGGNQDSYMDSDT